MAFKELSLKTVYRTYFEDVIHDFLIPVLNCSKKYYRGAGYFTLSGIYNVIDGLIPLIKRRGEVKIIVSPFLAQKDISIFKAADFNELIIETIINELEKEIENKEVVLRLLAKLIYENAIEVKVAYSSDGLFHEKFGLLFDDNGDIIEYIGSLNETDNAYKRNVESVMVLRSWENSQVYRDVDYFEKMWSDEFSQIKVVDLPLVIKNKLYVDFISTDDAKRSLDDLIKEFESLNKKESGQERSLYDYQEKAIEDFILNNNSHFFEMATGTGKTYTSIQLIKRIIEAGRTFVLILVPQIDLQTQWYEELQREGFEDVYLFGGNATDSFTDRFNKVLISYNFKGTKQRSVVCVSVYDTYFNKMFHRAKMIEDLFIIVDEAHNLTRVSLDKLPNNPKYRLGLSATPKKHDDDLSDKIKEYFIGKDRDSFKFTIEEAIERGFLSRYNYYPIFVELDSDEFDEFKNKTNRISALINMENIDKSQIEKIAMDRSLILKKAKNKLITLENILKSNQYSFINSVVYCGQGKNGDTEESLIDYVISLLTKYDLDVSSFTSKTENRQKVLKEFEKGYFDTLVAIKCFDEGVDVPKLDKIYIMASDRLVRQTIQRRGRVLRKCKETGKKLAFIYDFVVIPKQEYELEFASKKLIEIEFGRVREYMRLSENENDYSEVIANFEREFKVNMEDKEQLYDEEQES